MSTQPQSLTIIIPVYNEAGAVVSAVQRIVDFITPRVPQFEVLLVESGSSDGSAAECDLVSAFPRVRVIHESRRNGFGAAMRLGYANAVHDAVWLITVDLPFPLEAFDIAWPLLAQVPVVISYRAADPRSRARRTQSAIYNVLVRVLLHVRARHVNSAFKLFRRDIIQALPLSATGWLLDAEILMLLEERRVPYIEIPVPLIDRSGGRSSVGWGAGLRVLVDLVKLAAHRTKVSVSPS